MKNLKIYLFPILTLLSLISLDNPILWGEIGHKVVGEIAERKLDLYQKYSPWHYVNMPLDMEYENSKKNPKGDIVFALKQSIKILKNPDSAIEEKSFYLKFLIHLVGDIHQPLHTGKFEDRGGNDIKLTFLGKPTNANERRKLFIKS